MSQVTSLKQLYPLLSFIHIITGILAFHESLPQDSQSKGHYSGSQDALMAFSFIYHYFVFYSFPWLLPPSKIPTVLDSSQSLTESSTDICNLDSHQIAENTVLKQIVAEKHIIRNLCDLLCKLLKWKKADQGPRGTCGQTEGICLTSYFLRKARESCGYLPP